MKTGDIIVRTSYHQSIPVGSIGRVVSNWVNTTKSIEFVDICGIFLSNTPGECWRLATTEEEAAYTQGVRHIDHITPTVSTIMTTSNWKPRGQIIVRVDGGNKCCKEGSIFITAGLSNHGGCIASDNDKLEYPTYPGSWRLANKSEISAYKAGVRNINKMRHSALPPECHDEHTLVTPTFQKFITRLIDGPHVLHVDPDN